MKKYEPEYVGDEFVVRCVWMFMGCMTGVLYGISIGYLIWGNHHFIADVKIGVAWVSAFTRHVAG